MLLGDGNGRGVVQGGDETDYVRGFKDLVPLLADVAPDEGPGTGEAGDGSGDNRNPKSL